MENTENTARTPDIAFGRQLEKGKYILNALEFDTVALPSGETVEFIKKTTKVAEVWVWADDTTSLELWLFLKTQAGNEDPWAYSTHHRPSGVRVNKRFQFRWKALPPEVTSTVKLREEFDKRRRAIKDDASEIPRVEEEYSVAADCKNLPPP